MRPSFTFLALFALMFIPLAGDAHAAEGQRVSFAEFLASPSPVSVAALDDTLVTMWIQVGVTREAPCGTTGVGVAFTACSCNVELVEGGLGREGGVFLRARINPMILCPHCGVDSLVVPIGQLAPGHHSVAFRIEAEVLQPDGSVKIASREGVLEFDILSECPSPRLLDHWLVGPEPCDTCPPYRICPGEPIRLYLDGTLPDGCFRFAGVDLVPSIVDTVGPPTVRVRIERDCSPACPLVLTPWSQELFLPPLPGGAYILHLEVVLTDHCTSETRTTQREISYFEVRESCEPPPPYACLLPRWFGDGTPSDGCDVTLVEGEDAYSHFGVASTVALAGLQGEIVIADPGVRVESLVPDGPAEHMVLQWNRTERGARFVLFATSGTPIPPASRDQPISVLRFGFRASGAGPTQDVVVAHLTEFFGSDEAGNRVDGCVLIDAREQDPGLLHICRQRTCDLNGDGQADVRDLVLLAHCAVGVGTCPDPNGIDCQQDDDFDLDDVLCCARRILHGDLPDSAGVREEPSVAVTIAPPVRTAAGIDVPITLHGADRVGAARLAFDYPRDAFTVTGVDFPDAGSDWLALLEASDQGLLLGWIGLGVPFSERSLNAVVHLAVRPGSQASGELRMREVDLAGPDGVPLVDPAGEVSVPLSPRLRLALSAPRPNPSWGHTQITLTLSEAAEVQLAVHDLAGRIVAPVFHGVLPAGSRELSWNGRGSRGELPSGVYFFSARAEGVHAVQRLVLVKQGGPVRIPQLE